jgi:hypothetical protein
MDDEIVKLEENNTNNNMTHLASQQPIENSSAIPTTNADHQINDIFSKQKQPNVNLTKSKYHNRKSTKHLFFERLNRILLLAIIPLLLILCK